MYIYRYSEHVPMFILFDNDNHKIKIVDCYVLITVEVKKHIIHFSYKYILYNYNI